ncbi:uncharacterized protein LOC128751268 [Synchiropus splendidus]|uniref:uncharacterized protein LOC128751268 n=1 Tax=Synchiropus splendidus TaxID=270530 RepID=UPI00237E0F83|nr:uncharacterized protein LOC128751268 [Synchiropus splendidus]XP_053708150.1 uncharacterized protein LOC128751268 [Synchiropus splendidus]
MDLPNYPLPQLDVTLQEVRRVLHLTLSADAYADFNTALQQEGALLEKTHEDLADRAAGEENWVTGQFKSGLLSLDQPVPGSTALPAVLPAPSRTCSQLQRAAALLWSAATLHSAPSLLEEGVSLEDTQQSELFSTCRVPGKKQDQLKVYPESLHAIVICPEGVFPVDILSHSGGTKTARSVADIYSQLVKVEAAARCGKQNGHSSICSFSAQRRRSWAAVRDKVLESGGAAAASLEVVEGAVLALCLEDSDAPAELADTLNAVKLGRKDGGPTLRYYDKTVNVVVFQDSTAGMLFEHCAVDGMVAGLVAERMYRLSEMVDCSLLHASVIQNHQPRLLTLPLPSTIPSHSPIQETSRVQTLDVSSFPDVFSTLRAQRGLLDAWINFSLQLSLTQVLHESSSEHILVTPTHVRHFKHGRCDPTYSLSRQSLQLVGAMASALGPDNTLQHTPDLLQLFHAAFVEHKRLIKNTKCGHGVGPHVAVLRQSLLPDSPLKGFLDPFGRPSVYLSGCDLMEGVEFAVGNVYAPDQLVVTYLGKTDRVRVVLNANGSFAVVLEKLQAVFESNLKLVMLLAVRYAIVCQMGAQELLLKQKEEPGERMRAITERSTDYTLLIHGGAGEETLLNPHVVGVVEFALQTALSLGSEVLEHGGSSLDAVQRSVEALEDCFLFNAGKGSVFNKEGKNEMEAAIVDGTTSRCGSVACVTSVKNPVRAARCVMEKSSHSLIVGDGAEEFLQGAEPNDKPVGPDYFYTDIRHKQLMAKLSEVKNPRNNHPQTVGAVAVDHCLGLAAASSTGGLVGKLRGRVGDTAVVGAGIYADDKLAIACSGDGDVFLRHTVAHKIASLYHHKGYRLREACREVVRETLKGVCAGIIAVDLKGEAVIETNAAVMFVASRVDGASHVEVLKPARSFSNVIWETDEHVAYLHSNPWTPGSTVLTRKALSGPSSIFHLPPSAVMSLLRSSKVVAGFLCERLDVHRCAMLSHPSSSEPAQIRILPLHGLEQNCQRCISEEEEFHTHHTGYCTSKNGPRWDDEALSRVQAQIRSGLPTPNAPPCFDFFGDPSDGNLFSRIVRGEEPQWRVWEDAQHVAFLTPFPNTPGKTVVVPRKPLASDVFALEDADYQALILATYKVARLLESGLGATGVALIFEGLEINYAHAKLIPLLPAPSGSNVAQKQLECFQTYPGFVSSLDGPPAEPESLEKIHSQITECRPPSSWGDPPSHSTVAIKSQWYRNLFQIQNTLFHSTVEFFHGSCRFSYALTPLTTDTISSPMGLGSDSEPVSVNLLGQDIYLADSMQFILEYFLRFQENLQGTYYISPSFRGEDPDATHLNQFYHVECELLGDMDDAISTAESYLAHLTKAMLQKHSDIILKTAGTLEHVSALLAKLDGRRPLPRVPLDQAIPMMPSADCVEWVQEGQPMFGRKLTRKGERVLIQKYGGAVWLTEMDHLGVPFYQAYVAGTGHNKAKAADLLLGLGETLGLGERHSTAEMVQEALRHHAVPEQSYKWYIDMRRVKPLLTSGWGMGTERYLCWLLQHSDVRDMHIIPRMKGIKFMP